MDKRWPAYQEQSALHLRDTIGWDGIMKLIEQYSACIPFEHCTRSQQNLVAHEAKWLFEQWLLQKEWTLNSVCKQAAIVALLVLNKE